MRVLPSKNAPSIVIRRNRNLTNHIRILIQIVLPSLIVGYLFGVFVTSKEILSNRFDTPVPDVNSILAENETVSSNADDKQTSALIVDSQNPLAFIQKPKYSSLDMLDELSGLTGGKSGKKIDCPIPLIPFYDRVVRNANIHTTNSSTTTPQLIPQVLHISHASRCLPRDLISTLEQWKVALPNYSIFFHDDASVERLIYENEWPEFPNLHKIMKCVLPGAMTIDIWRVLLLFKYGGVYTDLDISPTDAFHEDLIDPDVSAFFFSDYFNWPTQWFIAAEARHPLLYLSMLNIRKNVIDNDRVHKPKVVELTGPAAFKWGFEVFLSNTADLIKTVGTATHTGLLGMKVQKIGRSETKLYVQEKLNYDEIVPLNATMNVTRRMRIHLETGIDHWTSLVKHNAKFRKDRGSCRAVLKKYDELGNKS